MDIRRYFKVMEKESAIPPSVRHALDAESWIEQGMLPILFEKSDEFSKSKKIEYNFDELWSLHPAEYGVVKYGDKIINTPRWQQSYCLPYYYSGMMHEAMPLPQAFKAFQDWSNSLEIGEFNQVLINWYENGGHYISRHSDHEQQIIPDSPIMSISLGQTRTFRIRNKNDDKIVLDLPMPDQSYVIMGGKMQKRFLHEVPKVNGAKGEAMGRRINITLRKFH